VTVPIYLDYQATTPLAPEVAAAMRPWLETGHGNPHSPHRMGREAAAAVEVAREQLKRLLLAEYVPDEDGNIRDAFPPPWDAGPASGKLYFTSGATEALNWAIKGSFANAAAERRRIVTVATEHAAVLDTVRWLESQGAELVVLPVGSDGLFDWQAARAAVNAQTALVAAMSVNNEIGVVQGMGLFHLADAARSAGAVMICDHVQGFGRVGTPLSYFDLIAVSAHKIHGPKGVGALWVRNGFAPAPLLHGGGQEGGVRSGTLSPALCVGFGTAAQLAMKRKQEDFGHVARLRDIACEMMSDWTINGSTESRYPGNLNMRRDGIDSSRLISEVRDVAFSAGSACASGSGRSSHVLAAIGLSDGEAKSSIRLGFGRYTTEGELTTALRQIRAAAERQLNFAA